MTMSIWTSQNITVSLSAVSDSNRLFAKCRAATTPLSQWAESVYAMCLRIHPYLSSLIIFTEDNEWLQLSLLIECSCKSRMWACLYTGIHGAFIGVQSQELGYDKRVINDTVIDSYINIMYIQLFYTWGPLSRSMWGSLRLAPLMYCFCTTDISGATTPHMNNPFVSCTSPTSCT